MSELKRCPFCGSTPTTRVIIASFGGNTDKLNFSIECEKCGVSKGVSLGFPFSANFTDVEKSMENVKKIWNTRAYEDNKVVAKIKSSGHPNGVFGDCPICGGYCVNEEPYCPHCGTKLEWE